jgi:Spy/CpxP family protein refolding chaperone
MTTKRRWLLGVAVAAGVALVGSAAAFAFGGPHGGRQHLMKRFVAAAIDDALDAAKVTPEQRARIHAVRDRTLATVETHMTDRRGRMDALLTVFESDRIDLAAVQVMRAQQEDQHRRIADTVQSALLEVHDTLTPEQRRIVADWVRQHRRHRGH